jgi:phage-related protein
MKVRSVIAYKNYFFDFLIHQRPKVKEKIYWTIKVFEEIKVIPTEYLKHIEGTNGLYEMRIQLGSDAFRIFCFFDNGNCVILGNGFQKKTQRTPLQEIERALQIKKEYENEK